MTRKPVRRREFLLGTGAASTALLAGCLGDGNAAAESGPSTLKAGGSSTVYPITSDGSSV